MKSERQQNQESDLLADKIENFLLKLRAVLPAIIAVGAIVIVGLIAFGFYTSMKNNNAAQAWGALYFSDSDPVELQGISEEFGSTPAGLWALQIAGDGHVAKALENVYTNRDIADQHYENAIKEYEKVVKVAKEGLLQSRSYFGLAQSYEGLGKRDEAIANYRKVVGVRIADAELKAVCTKRAEWLESKEGESFMAFYKSNRQSIPAVGPPTSIKPEVPSAPTSDFQNVPGVESEPQTAGETPDQSSKPEAAQPASGEATSND